MLFNSIHFLFFLPVVTVLYYMLPFRFRWILLFVASCYFYMAFVPEYILILFLIILIDYFSALAIQRNHGAHRRRWLVFSLASNILLLCFFKYFNFLNWNIAALASFSGMPVKPLVLDILLPIGLSFHTFQSMSYTIEVYKGRQKAETHLGYFANYVLFFPQMVAGPIERYEHLGVQLRQEHKPLYENFALGFRLIVFGLLVKMAIADNLAPFVNEVYAAPASYGATDILLAVIFFSFQIYADFYGYSTIACGAAKVLGIDIMDNFRTPYLSRSIGEFWTRWHISLSTWFRDYLYIPLGGNRVKVPRYMVNIMIVFTVSGLWHGASWTFVAWGALHGAYLLIESLLLKRKRKDAFRAAQIPGVVLTFTLVTFAWIFFRAADFANAGEIISGLTSGRAAVTGLRELYLPLGAIAVLIFSDIMLYRSRIDRKLAGFDVYTRWAAYSLLLFLLMSLSGTQKFTFIYFQF